MLLHGKVAPGMTGSIELIINPEGTQTSLSYDITIDETKLNEINTALKIVSITEENGRSLTINGLNATGKNDDIVTISRVMKLADIKNGIKDVIKINFKWPNGDDIADSELGTMDSTKISLPVRFHAIQYTGP